MGPPIYIEGLIGAGKTSVVSALKQKYDQNPTLGIKCYLEPVDRYKKFVYKAQSFNPLKIMYEGGQADKFPVQLHICNQSFQYYSQKMQNDVMKYPMKIFERSIFSNLTFIQTYQDMGFLSDFASAYLLKLTGKHRQAFYNVYPSVVIYLDIAVDLALDRIKQRGREGEQNLTAEFLECLKKNQIKQLELFKVCEPKVTVIKIPVGQRTSLDEIVAKCDRIAQSCLRYEKTKDDLFRDRYTKRQDHIKKRVFLRRSSLPTPEAKKTYCEDEERYWLWDEDF